MKLTEHQEKVKNDIVNSLLEGEKRIVLKGSAGVGKTTCVNEIIESYMDHCTRELDKVYILAPTNKAVGVLMEKTNQEEYKVFKTIHSALSLKRVIDEKSGEVYFKQPKKSKSFEDGVLIVIDEASMLSAELISLVTNSVLPIIFIGDEAQLPPVNEEKSRIFEFGYDTYELTEIIRQAEGNPIIDLSRKLKKINSFVNDVNESKQGYVFTSRLDVCVDRMLEDIDNVKYLAWTNSDVDYKNQIIRRERFGENADAIMEGEIIVMDEPFGRIYYTSEEVKVREVKTEPRNYTIHFTGKKATEEENYLKSVLKVQFKCYIINNVMPVIHEDSLHDFNDTLKYIKGLVKEGISTWQDYFDFKEHFGYYKYSYALTVHKSQGSTYKTVIANHSDIERSKKYSVYKKLWYTAITRASEKLILLV